MRSSRPRAWPLALALMLPAACATVPSRPAAIIDRAAGLNPCRDVPLRSYPPAQMRALADEVDAAPVSAAWPGFVADYAHERTLLRACQGIGR